MLFVAFPWQRDKAQVQRTSIELSGFYSSLNKRQRDTQVPHNQVEIIKADTAHVSKALSPVGNEDDLL